MKDINKIFTYLNRLYETVRKDWQLISKNSTDRIIETFQGKEYPKETKVNNPDEISDPIVDAQNDTTQAIKEIKIPEPIPVDFSALEAKLEALLKALEKKEMTVNVGKTNVEVDTKSVVKAIEKLQKSIPKLEKQEIIDYTLMFSEMMDIMEKPFDQTEIRAIGNLISKLGTSADLAVIAEYLQTLIDKPNPEFPELPIKNGRLLVAVDKVGGGGGGLTQIETNYLKAIADNTDTLEVIGDPLLKYKYADVDDDASPNYFGATDKDGNWYILKETISAGANTYRYAAGTSDYTTNWINRASLTYDYFNVIF